MYTYVCAHEACLNAYAPCIEKKHGPGTTNLFWLAHASRRQWCCFFLILDCSLQGSKPHLEDSDSIETRESIASLAKCTYQSYACTFAVDSSMRSMQGCRIKRKFLFLCQLAQIRFGFRAGFVYIYIYVCMCIYIYILYVSIYVCGCKRTHKDSYQCLPKSSAPCTKNNARANLNFWSLETTLSQYCWSFAQLPNA